MARLPRIYLEETVYYVTNKASHGQNIFEDAGDYVAFLELLKKYKEQYGFKLYAYALMPGHFHLLLESSLKQDENDPAGISRIMHDLNSSYTKYFNGRYNRKGHLFMARYKAALVEKSPYLLKLTAYIHLNPQRLNIVSDAGDYPYSSYRLYLNKEISLEGLMKSERDEVFSLLGAKSYQEFVNGVITELNLSFHQQLRKGVLGTKDFQDKVKEILASYNKEEDSQSSHFVRNMGITGLVVLVLSLGLSYAIKVVLREKAKTVSVISGYKLSEQIQGLLKDLDNSEYQISIVSNSGGDVHKDTIKFKDGRFISEDLVSRGYFPNEYSLIIENDQKIIWKAVMQRGDKSFASWQGEIVKAKEMQGTLKIQQKELPVRDFTFVSAGYAGVEK